MGCCCCSKIRFPEPQGPHRVSAIIHRFPGSPQCQIFYPSSPSTESPQSHRGYWRSEVVETALSSNDLNCCSRACLRCCVGWRLTDTPHPCASDPALNTKFPVVLFSHGLYGTMEMYTTLCLLLASYGYIVVALEHEDGSAMFAQPHESTEPLPYKATDPEPQPPKGWEGMTEGSAEHYSWCEKSHQFHQQHRQPFLDKRSAELQTVLRAIRTPQGEPQCAVTGSMDPDKISLMGHSFGSATVMRASVEMEFEFSAAVLLDLWSTPVPSNCFVENAVPSLFIGSEQFRDTPFTKILTKDLAAKASCGINRTAAVDKGLLVHHDVDYTNLQEYRAVEIHDDVPPCELMYMRNSVHQQCSDTPQICPGWFGRKFYASGDTDSDLQQHVLSKTIAEFLAKHNGVALDDRANSEIGDQF